MEDHKCIFCHGDGCDCCNDTGWDTEYTSEIVCPWCGHEFSDSWEYNDDDGKEIDCVECGKPIMLSVDFSVSYVTRRKEE